MSLSCGPCFINADGSQLQDPVLDMGGSGIVIQRGDKAIKLPLLHSTAGLCENDVDYFQMCNLNAQKSLCREKEVYRRLGQSRGIVRCLDLSGPGIQMVLMTNGNVRKYLTGYRPTKSVQLAWFRDMAQALIYIHNRCVLVTDIAARNNFSDFTESTIIPLGTDMQDADDCGYSIYTDIGELGTVMYEVITGKPCKFDLFKDQPPGPATAAWPRREDLPNTENIWLGSIIDSCWIKGAFQNACKLSEALASITLD